MKIARGFTLIELMVVVAVISILAVIAVPKFGEAVRKSKDASTKGNLGSIRSALSIYAADNNGGFPSDHLDSLSVGKHYLDGVPYATMYPYHDRSNKVDNTADWGAAIGDQDSTHWMYFDDATLETASTPKKGDVWAGCTHEDSTGRIWSTN